MTPGEKLRFTGPAGAPFLVTVGEVFSAAYISARVAAGEWTPVEDEKPKTAAPVRRKSTSK